MHALTRLFTLAMPCSIRACILRCRYAQTLRQYQSSLAAADASSTPINHSTDRLPRCQKARLFDQQMKHNACERRGNGYLSINLAKDVAVIVPSMYPQSNNATHAFPGSTLIPRQKTKRPCSDTRILATCLPVPLRAMPPAFDGSRSSVSRHPRHIGLTVTYEG